MACRGCFPVLFGGLFALFSGGHLLLGALSGILAAYPLTTEFSAWYAASTIFAVAIVLAMTAYSFHTAVAGPWLFKAGFLDDDSKNSKHFGTNSSIFTSQQVAWGSVPGRDYQPLDSARF